MKCDCGADILLDKEKKNGKCSWCYHGLLKPEEEDARIAEKRKKGKKSAETGKNSEYETEKGSKNDDPDELSF